MTAKQPLSALELTMEPDGVTYSTQGSATRHTYSTHDGVAYSTYEWEDARTGKAVTIHKCHTSWTSQIMEHVAALDNLDIPMRDKPWHSLGWTRIPEPASWHPNPAVRNRSMTAAYRAGSDYMEKEALTHWTKWAVEVAKFAAYAEKEKAIDELQA